MFKVNTQIGKKDKFRTNCFWNQRRRAKNNGNSSRTRFRIDLNFFFQLVRIGTKQFSNDYIVWSMKGNWEALRVNRMEYIVLRQVECVFLFLLYCARQYLSKAFKVCVFGCGCVCALHWLDRERAARLFNYKLKPWTETVWLQSDQWWCSSQSNRWWNGSLLAVRVLNLFCWEKLSS